MLGQRVSEMLSLQGLNFVGVSRKDGTKFDFERESFSLFAEKEELSEDDWVINCVGWIAQKASKIPEANLKRATQLNTSLPRDIVLEQGTRGFGWIQIATDCVFDGREGHYLENAQKQATDLYSYSKIEGERHTYGAVQIRTSIVGSDPAAKSGLFEWFRNLPYGSIVEGYTNHFWNGVSTNAFGKLVAGLILSGMRLPVTQHWIPQDSVSKYELLLLFKELLGREDLKIVPEKRSQAIDRRLGVSNSEENLKLWNLAGYSRDQTVEELIRQMIFDDSQEKKGSF